MHPWRLVGSIPQTSHEVEEQLQAEVAARETVVETQGVPIKKHALDKVRKQLSGVAALVDVWWQEVWHRTSRSHSHKLLNLLNISFMVHTGLKNNENRIQRFQRGAECA